MIAENELPVTCSTCYIAWCHAHGFQSCDFNTDIEKAKFTITNLTKISI
ncbi:conserved hypothetical protein [Xenorhabdus innexi]|uniref:Uncharacterized protein n=1 Tax=Xenorhabdus innexi TaxID=290109 RepID=A0A1N6N0R0_9GAMM|nr:conserved hypothetical protein [Xenorhabdus innexi]